MTAQATTNTQSSNRIAAWLAWSLWLLTMAIAAAGLVLLALNWSTPAPARWGFRGFQSLNAIPISTVGALVAWHRPQNAIGRILLVSGILGGFTGLGEEFAAYTLLTRPGLLPGGAIMAGLANWLWIPSMGLALIHTLLLFPDGRFLTPRWRVIAWLGAAWIVVGSIRLVIEPGPLTNLSIASNPFGLEGLKTRLPWLALPLGATMGFGLLPMGAAALSLIMRFRHSGGEVRQQLKWIAYAAALLPFAGVVGQFESLAADLLLFLLAAAFPTATAIAILRHRLYDIDVLINRTLVYGALTGALAVVYFGSVVLLQGVLRALTGQESQLAVVASTLAIAALFMPLRRRVQDFIDRRFYRRKYDAEQTLARFAVTARDEVDVERLEGALLHVATDTMRPEWVSLWLAPAADRPRTADRGRRSFS